MNTVTVALNYTSPSLFFTNNDQLLCGKKTPYLLKAFCDQNNKDLYWLMYEDGKFTGDGFTYEELAKYCPNHNVIL